MATSGIVKSWTTPSGSTTAEGKSYAGAYFSWEWTSKQTAKGQTTVTWTLYGKGRTASPSWLSNSCKIDIVHNGVTTTIRNTAWEKNHNWNTGENCSFDASSTYSKRASDSFVIQHDSNGAATFTVNMTVAIYTTTTHSTSERVTLDTNSPYYKVKYNANGGTGAPSAQNKTPGVSLTLSSTKPSYTGRTFQGWGTSSTDTSVDYAAGASYTTDKDITLYAIWKLNTYKVQYNANGYAVSSGLPSQQTKTYGTALTLSSSTPVISNATVTGYKVTFNANGGTCSTSSLTSNRTRVATFSHWNTKADNSGTTYNKGASYTSNAAATMYLQATSTYTNLSITLPTATRSGYDFLGWSTSSSATTGTTGSYTPSAATTLYAVWKVQGLAHIDTGSAWKAHTVWIDNGTTWKQYVPYVDTGSAWKICGE